MANLIANQPTNLITYTPIANALTYVQYASVIPTSASINVNGSNYFFTGAKNCIGSFSSSSNLLAIDASLVEQLDETSTPSSFPNTIVSLNLSNLKYSLGSLSLGSTSSTTIINLNSLKYGNVLSLTFNSSVTSYSLPALIGIPTSMTIAASGLTSLSLPNLEFVLSSLSLSQTIVSIVSLPKLIYAGSIQLPGTTVTSLSLPSLIYLSSISLSNGNSITSISLPVLQTLDTMRNITSTSINSITLPSIVEIGGTSNSISFVSSMTALSTFTLGSGLKKVGANVIFSNPPLNQASVDNILVRLAALDGTNGTTTYSSKTVTLTGAASTPSATGLSAKSTLVARGCTVTNN